MIIDTFIHTATKVCCFQLAFKKRGNGRERIWNSRKSGKVCSQDKNFFLLKKINTPKNVNLNKILKKVKAQPRMFD